MPKSQLPVSSSEPGGRRLAPATAFTVTGLLFFGFFVAAGAPTPILVVLQRQWSFSAAMLTAAFVAYVATLLLALLVMGSLSDHIGRRPVILAAVVIEAAAMALFFRAHSVAGLIAARTVQGLASGMGNGVLSAFALEIAPAGRKHLGALVSSIAPMAGMAIGALLSGLVVSMTDHPLLPVFLTMTLLFVAGGILAFRMPETRVGQPGAWASLIPRLKIPAAARTEFLRALWVLAAIWSLCGVYLALAPSMIAAAFSIYSGVVHGLAVTVQTGVAAFAPMGLRRLDAHRAAAVSMAAVAVGAGLAAIALSTASTTLFFVATAVGGIGLGGGFSSVVRILAGLAQAHDRAGLFAALFVASYIALGAPPMIAGVAIGHFGLLPTARIYFLIVLIAAIAGGIAYARAARAATRPER